MPGYLYGMAKCGWGTTGESARIMVQFRAARINGRGDRALTPCPHSYS